MTSDANLGREGAGVPDRDFAGCAPVDGPADAYEALLGRLKREAVPYSVLWELTHTCNFKCVMCYNEPLREPELTTAECFDILEQLAAAGTLQLTLTGGEILTRRDFVEIATRARQLGFAIDLKTNGSLITAEVADRIAALAPVQVDISLLGATPETFDAVAGVPHSLARVLRGVGLLQERGVRVKLNTLLLALNVAERAAMIDLALDLGVYCEQVFKVSPTDSGRSKGEKHQLSLAEMADVLVADNTPFIPRALEPGSRTCSVGLSSALISPYGVVYPCVELRIPAGRLRQQRFADIWAEAPVFRQLRAQHTRQNLPECRVCPIARYCEGRCSGLAWKERGDLYGGHTLACRQAQARYQQQHAGETAPDTPWLSAQRLRGPAGQHSGEPIKLIDSHSS